MNIKIKGNVSFWSFKEIKVGDVVINVPEDDLWQAVSVFKGDLIEAEVKIVSGSPAFQVGLYKFNLLDFELV